MITYEKNFTLELPPALQHFSSFHEQSKEKLFAHGEAVEMLGVLEHEILVSLEEEAQMYNQTATILSFRANLYEILKNCYDAVIMRNRYAGKTTNHIRMNSVTPTKTLEVSIELSDDEGMIELKIKDNGIGINTAQFLQGHNFFRKIDDPLLTGGAHKGNVTLKASLDNFCNPGDEKEISYKANKVDFGTTLSIKSNNQLSQIKFYRHSEFNASDDNEIEDILSNCPILSKNR